MSAIHTAELVCFVLGFLAAFLFLGVAWTGVDAVRAWRDGEALRDELERAKRREDER